MLIRSGNLAISPVPHRLEPILCFPSLLTHATERIKELGKNSFVSLGMKGRLYILKFVFLHVHRAAMLLQ